MNDSLVVVVDRDEETAHELRALIEEADFECQIVASVSNFDKEVDGSPAIVFAGCDDDPDGLVELLATEPVRRANEIVAVGSREHSESLREHIGRERTRLRAPAAPPCRPLLSWSRRACGRATNSRHPSTGSSPW